MKVTVKKTPAPRKKPAVRRAKAKSRRTIVLQQATRSTGHLSYTRAIMLALAMIAIALALFFFIKALDELAPAPVSTSGKYVPRVSPPTEPPPYR